MRIIYRGVYAGFPAAALHTGDLAYATDLLVLFLSSGVAWVAYHDYPDYQGEKAGLYPAPEWGAFEGVDMNWAATGNLIGHAANISVNYIVPAGRTLYISHCSFFITGTAAADSDNNQIGALRLYAPILATNVINLGGNGGNSMVLSRPLRIDATQGLWIILWCFANHNCFIGYSVSGYMI